MSKKENLKKLALYLFGKRSSRSFSMESYCVRPYHMFHNSHSYFVDVCDAEKHLCGTVACAAGHGPRAGIKPTKDDECWGDYIGRVFTSSTYRLAWCFASYWRSIDNTPRGAACRIAYMLEYGVPDKDSKQYSYDNCLKLGRKVLENWVS